MPPKTPPAVPETKPKRSTPQPSDETLAIRALRETRKLRARADSAFATYTTTRNECVEASAQIIAGLSTGARAIFDKLSPSAETEKAAE